MPATERFFTSAVAAFALFVIWQSYNYGIVSSTITGPGFFPAIAGIVMLASAAVSLFATSRKASETTAPLDDDVEGAAPTSTRVEVIRVALLVGITILLILLSPIIGMVALTPFYVFACFLVLTPDFAPKRMAVGAVTAILFTLLAWLVFDRALGIPLPKGLF